MSLFSSGNRQNYLDQNKNWSASKLSVGSLHVSFLWMKTSKYSCLISEGKICFIKSLHWIIAFAFSRTQDVHIVIFKYFYFFYFQNVILTSILVLVPHHTKWQGNMWYTPKRVACTSGCLFVPNRFSDDNMRTDQYCFCLKHCMVV